MAEGQFSGPLPGYQSDGLQLHVKYCSTLWSARLVSQARVVDKGLSEADPGALLFPTGTPNVKWLFNIIVVRWCHAIDPTHYGVGIHCASLIDDHDCWAVGWMLSWWLLPGDIDICFMDLLALLMLNTPFSFASTRIQIKPHTHVFTSHMVVIVHPGRRWSDYESDVDWGVCTELRDFTVNALFYDPKTNDIVDFVGGIQDLQVGFGRMIPGLLTLSELCQFFCE